MNPQTGTIQKLRFQAEKQMAAHTSRKVRLDMYGSIQDQTWHQVRLRLWAWVHSEMNEQHRHP